MIIGIPKEIKEFENRVAITPSGVEQLVKTKHTIYIEENAGIGSGFSDEEYKESGAIIATANEVWKKAEMIMKVKEPLKQEYKYFRKHLILFTYLHLAADKELTEELVNKGVTSIAYETVQLESGALPLLTPMSEIAGRMSVQIGARLLEKQNGGKGILIGGVTGVNAGHTVVIGAGIVGTNAARMAMGLGSNVTVIDNNINRLRQLDELYNGRLQTLMSNPYNIANAVKTADLLIGSVLIPGAKAPKLVSEEMVKTMSKGSVIIDVAIDQGGSIDTIDRVTTHFNPTYEKHGVIHYSVANMPGSVPRTSTIALTNATISYALEIANKGLDKALYNNAIYKGVNTFKNLLTHKGVAESFNMKYDEIMKNI
jgi:alanine dehydrogenase